MMVIQSVKLPKKSGTERTVEIMMPIKEAVEILKKMLACRMRIRCGTHCTECPNWDTHIRKVSALETAIAHLDKSEGCDGCKHLKGGDRFWVRQKCSRQYADKYERKDDKSNE